MGVWSMRKRGSDIWEEWVCATCLLDDIDTCHEFRHWVLHLQSRIHLQKVMPLLRVH